MMHPVDFLADILARPQDDAPRLRYAEWLEAEQDPLGEFIHVQCRLAELPADDPDVLEWEGREQELLAEHEKQWVGALAGMVQWCVFRRGFIEEIALTSAQFLRHAPALFRRAPIQEVHLSRVRDHVTRLASSTFLRKPCYLDLSANPLHDNGITTLACSPYLARVQGLNLSSSGIGDLGLKALASSPYLTGLRELYLCDNHISDAGIRALAGSPLADQLQTLHLGFNAIGSDGASLLQRRFGARVHL